jgi:hypothetical protein
MTAAAAATVAAAEASAHALPALPPAKDIPASFGASFRHWCVAFQVASQPSILLDRAGGL